MHNQATFNNEPRRPFWIHHMITGIPYIIFDDDLRNPNSGAAPVRLDGGTGGYEIQELIKKAAANRPRRPKPIDAATGNERVNERNPHVGYPTYC